MAEGRNCGQEATQQHQTFHNSTAATARRVSSVCRPFVSLLAHYVPASSVWRPVRRTADLNSVLFEDAVTAFPKTDRRNSFGGLTSPLNALAACFIRWIYSSGLIPDQSMWDLWCTKWHWQVPLRVLLFSPVTFSAPTLDFPSFILPSRLMHDVTTASVIKMGRVQFRQVAVLNLTTSANVCGLLLSSKTNLRYQNRPLPLPSTNLAVHYVQLLSHLTMWN